MKTAIKTLLLATTIVVLSACDIIDNPVQTPDINPPDTGTYNQNVLLEDYTGHTCGNCPAAAEEAHLIETTFGKDRVIVVAVHAGPFAFTNSSYPLDWTCPEGNELDQTFRNSRAGNPNGLVNRTERSGKFILSKDDWAPATVVELAKDPRMGLSAESSWDADSKTVTVDVDMTFLTEGTPDYQIVAIITESKLVGDQLDYRKTPSHVEDYEFDHVLRTSINGTWGEPISAENIEAGTEMKKQFEYTFSSSSGWVPENCDVVVYVHQYNTTKEIVQVTKVGVVE